jgi:hypothetical protein
VVPLSGRKCGGDQVFSAEGGKEYKTLRKEERKERQNGGRTSPLIYINPPLLI